MWQLVDFLTAGGSTTWAVLAAGLFLLGLVVFQGTRRDGADMDLLTWPGIAVLLMAGALGTVLHGPIAVQAGTADESARRTLFRFSEALYPLQLAAIMAAICILAAGISATLRRRRPRLIALSLAATLVPLAGLSVTYGWAAVRFHALLAHCLEPCSSTLFVYPREGQLEDDQLPHSSSTDRLRYGPVLSLTRESVTLDDGSTLKLGEDAVLDLPDKPFDQRWIYEHPLYEMLSERHTRYWQAKEYENVKFQMIGEPGTVLVVAAEGDVPASQLNAVAAIAGQSRFGGLELAVHNDRYDCATALVFRPQQWLGGAVCGGLSLPWYWESEDTSSELFLGVHVGQDGFTVVGNDDQLDEHQTLLLPPERCEPTIPLDADGALDYGGLSDLLDQVETEYPEERLAMLLSEPDVPMQQLVHTLEVMTDAGPRDGNQPERRFLRVTWMSWYDERIADCMSAVE